MNALTSELPRAAPLRRVIGLARPVRARLALAVLAGVGAAGAAVGLTATSAWLISRASEQPPSSHAPRSLGGSTGLSLQTVHGPSGESAVASEIGP